MVHFSQVSLGIPKVNITFKFCGTFLLTASSWEISTIRFVLNLRFVPRIFFSLESVDDKKESLIHLSLYTTQSTALFLEADTKLSKRNRLSRHSRVHIKKRDFVQYHRQAAAAVHIILPPSPKRSCSLLTNVSVYT